MTFKTHRLCYNLFGPFLGIRRNWILRSILLDYKNDDLKSIKSKSLEKISFRLWNLFSVLPPPPPLYFWYWQLGSKSVWPLKHLKTLGAKTNLSSKTVKCWQSLYRGHWKQAFSQYTNSSVWRLHTASHNRCIILTLSSNRRWIFDIFSVTKD